MISDNLIVTLPNCISETIEDSVSVKACQLPIASKVNKTNQISISSQQVRTRLEKPQCVSKTI